MAKLIRYKCSCPYCNNITMFGPEEKEFACSRCNGQMVIIDREYDDTEEQSSINKIVYAILSTVILFAIIVGAIIVHSNSTVPNTHYEEIEDVVIDDYGSGVAEVNEDTIDLGYLEDSEGAYYGNDTYTIKLVDYTVTIPRPKGMKLSTIYEDSDYPYISFNASNYKVTCDFRESQYTEIESIVTWYDADAMEHGTIGDKEYLITTTHYGSDTSYKIFQDIGGSRLLEIYLSCHNASIDKNYVKSLLIQEQYFITE